MQHREINSQQASTLNVAVTNAVPNLSEDTGTRPTVHWYDKNPHTFIKPERKHVTILIGGLTQFHDQFMEVGLETNGCKIKALDCPDTAAFQLGKEYGNRGQCNPVYFVVGNLLKYLLYLHNEKGLSKDEIVKNYIFLTAGSCGPCRFGAYLTEYRKILRDAGFEKFRVLEFMAGVGIYQMNGDEAGLELTPKFFFSLFRCAMVGDVLNLLGYRIRPYELVKGSTDEALTQCREIVVNALKNKNSLFVALYKCRKILKKIKVNKLQAKPKVAIFGEFFAVTTEGDGNYNLQRYLESEGAEVDIQPLMNMILYLLWELKYNVDQTYQLSDKDKPEGGLDFSPMKKSFLFWLARFALKTYFYSYAKCAGLDSYELSDMDHLAKLSEKYQSLDLHASDGPMEIGKLIKYVTRKKSHMVISVKPFGCLPHSNVTDGIQSLVTAHYPEANFLPIETSGDGAVSVYSRIQMSLFRARKEAQEEFDNALAEKGMVIDRAEMKLQQKSKWANALHVPKHKVACSAANLVCEL